jgi:hypothetical protein
MFLWFPVLDLARAPRRTARKKGSGYENGVESWRHCSRVAHTRLHFLTAKWLNVIVPGK